MRQLARAPPGRGGRRPARGPGAARASSTPTCTSRRCGSSARSACRCSTGSSGARCRRRPGSPTSTTPARSPASSSRRWPTAGTTTALVFGAHFAAAVDVLFEAAARARAAGHQRAGGRATGCCGDDLHTTAERAYDEGRALAERWHGVGPQPVRGDPAVLAVVHRRAARLLRGSAPRRRRQLVHLAHQREPGRDRRRQRAVRARELPRQLRPARPGRAAQRVRAQRACHPARAAAAGRAGRERRALPDQQRRTRQRPVPARRHLAAGVRVALGCDVGAGTGFSLFKEGLQAYFMQQLRRR